MKIQWEKLGTISDNEFQKIIGYIQFSSWAGIVLGVTCILYLLGWFLFRMDTLNIITGSERSSIILLIIGGTYYLQGRGGFVRIVEYRFIRQMLKRFA